MTNKRIGVWLAKGGTAKTSVSVNLAAGLAMVRDSSNGRLVPREESGPRVLLVDLDSQGDATRWLRPDLRNPDTLATPLTAGGSLDAVAVPTDVPGLDLIPASAALVKAEAELRARPMGIVAVKRLFDSMPGRWEWVIFDLAPGTAMLTMAGLVACNAALLPAIPDTMSLSGIGTAIETIAELRDPAVTDLRLLGVLPTRVDRRTALTGESLVAAREALGDQVFASELRTCARMAEAPGSGESIYTYSPGCRSALDMAAIVDEVTACMTAGEE